MPLDYLPGTFFGPNTLVELVRVRAEYQPQDVAFIYLVDGEEQQVDITYAELDRRARALAAWLGQLGLTGERALLLYPPGLDFIVGFFGCLYAGVTAVPVYPPRRSRSLERIEAIADDAQAAVALIPEAVFRRVEPVIAESARLQRLRWLAPCRHPEGIEDSWQMPEIHADTLAVLQYTSGSTGSPKGVMLTHANVIHNSALIAYAFEHTRSGLGVFWLPSYHDMGLIGGIVQPLYCGRPNVLMSPMAFLQRPFRWLWAISRFRGTTSGGPNFAYDLCVRNISPEERKRLDLSSWEVAFNGAEPVRAETIEAFCRTFEPCGFRPEAFYPCYGLAEATLIVSGGYVHQRPMIRPFDRQALAEGRAVERTDGTANPQRLVGCGQTLADQEIAIVDPQTCRRLPEGKVGEIWVRGPSVAQGYWNHPEATRETFHAHLADSGEGPYLRTGDLGFLRHGQLFVTGRIKDVIILRGMNLYPQDIERTVQQSHPRLRPNCGAAFTIDDGGRERLVVVQEVERRKRGDFEGVFDAIRRAVAAAHEWPVDVIVLIKAGSIPKTSSGKIQRLACRQAFLEGRLAVVAQWEADREQGQGAMVAAAAGPASGRSHHGEPISTDKVAADRRAVAAAALAGGSRRPVAEQPRGGNSNGGAGRSDGNGQATGAGKATADREELIRLVFEEVSRVARGPAGGLTLDTNIREIGLDSLQRMEIVAALEERFGGRFPEHVLFELETCGQVVDAVERYLVNGRAGHRARTALTPQETPGDVPVGELPLVEKAGVANPFLANHQGRTGPRMTVEGRRVIHFAHYDYLGMASDPQVIRAAQEAVAAYGVSVCASRLMSGQRSVHDELETALAKLLGVQSAVVLDGSHSAVQATLSYLCGAEDLVLLDALAAKSLALAAVLGGARRETFPHNDWQAAEDLLVRSRGACRRAVVVIEGASPMAGDLAPLPRFIDACRRQGAIVLVDQSHSLGTVGRQGRGVTEHFGIDPQEVDIWTGTLSCALGSSGGYIAGSRRMVEHLKYAAPGVATPVGLAPASAAAALAAIRRLQEEPQRVGRLQENVRLFAELARQHGLDTGTSGQAPVVPIILGNSTQCLKLSEVLRRRGIFVQPVLYPAVEEQAARLRFFLNAGHTADEIRQTVDALAEEIKRLHVDQTPCPAPEAA